jgi:hypothetical protein
MGPISSKGEFCIIKDSLRGESHHFQPKRVLSISSHFIVDNLFCFIQ